MPQIRLVPSTYYLSNTQYLSVSNASNMYANTDSTTYATVTNSRSQTTAYYAYIRGFNFSDVPSDVIVNSITIKLKASHSGGNTGTIYCYDGTTQISAAGSTTALGTSATVKTFTNTTIDWDTLKGYGSDFGIRINCRRNNKNTQATFNIYGAEILVDYTIPVYHSVSFNNTSSVSISPSTTQSVIEGNNLTIQINTSNKNAVRVSDNNVDVSSQIVQGASNCTYTISNVQVDHTISVTDAPSYNVSITNNSETVTTQPSSNQTLFEGDSQSITFYNISSLDDVAITDNNSDIESSLVHSTSRNITENLVPSTLEDYSGYNISGQDNGCTGTDSDTRAQLGLRSQSSGAYMIYSFNVPTIPTNATNISVSCSVRAYISSTSTSITNKTAQLYSGTTAKGSAYTIPTSDSTFSLDTGSWTASELNNIKLRLEATYGNTSNYYLYFYGADLTVSYTVVEDTYTYTITNISSDHAIVIADAAATPYFLKVNGEYRAVKKFFRKINNTWVEIDVSQLSIAGPFFYKGWQEEIIYDVIGEVIRSSSDITIVINDNTLSPGDYTLYYEDETGNIISGVDEIANITIS